MFKLSFILYFLKLCFGSEVNIIPLITTETFTSFANFN